MRPMALPSYTEISDLLKKGAIPEAQELIMRLREAAVQLREENDSLKEQLNQLRAKLDFRNKLRFEESVYWIQEEDGRKDGPFCPICYENNGKLNRLHSARQAIIPAKWGCPFCLNQFDPK